MNAENIQRLIEHYKQVETLPDWSYNHCIAGVLRNMNLISSLSDDSEVAEALDVSRDGARELIYGMANKMSHGDGALTYNKRLVVETLERILVTGKVQVGFTKVAEIVDRQNGQN